MRTRGGGHMILRNRLLFGFVLLIIVLISHMSYAHSIFDPNGNIPGRTTAVQKVGPCGGIARTGHEKALMTSSTVRVDWLETIQHPGRYEFYLSTADDQNFTLIKTVPDDQNGTGDLPHVFNTMLTLPTGITCDHCTLQMIQVMTENPANPTNYYSCADISISSAGSTSPAPLPTPAPAPAPAQGAHCD